MRASRRSEDLVRIICRGLLSRSVRPVPIPGRKVRSVRSYLNVTNGRRLRGRISGCVSNGGPLFGGNKPVLQRLLATNVGLKEKEIVERTPLEQYDYLVSRGQIRDDSFQRSIVALLVALHEAIQNYHPPPIEYPSIDDLKPKKGILGLLSLHKPNFHRRISLDDVPKGIYLYGDVGCGKTMLMDMFYSTIPTSVLSKRRIHFHAFMQDVHKRAHALKVQHGSEFDSIPMLAAALADEARILCFDEFQVVDVADAMLLRRLFEALVHHGVIFVVTSNRAPDDLYKNGIQRQSFIPCIELIKERLRVICLDSPTDYRRIERPLRNVYHSPLDENAKEHADLWFNYFANPRDPPHPAIHTIWGRQLHVPKASGKVAQFTFDELCGKPMSAADYLELARNYRAFVVTDIPTLTIQNKDKARRFITFLDAVYESRGKLVATSAVPFSEILVDDRHDLVGPKEMDRDMLDMIGEMGVNNDTLKNLNLFTGDEEVFAFARALSRLQQMSSAQWVDAED
ncbi:AFG1-like ATPase-domain-containing protein [Lipomyces kononenkoae]|uniref:AFG1-like ATPase-domain-containing protein n=1 Tax=Lipomyces kononenkoae TaxID=34357 RepID=A0ACC3T785_LIPKO